MNYLVNTTFFVEDSFVEDVIKWLKADYKNAVTAVEDFSEPLITTILVKTEPDVTGICLQFKSNDLDATNSWLETEGQKLHQHLMRLHPGKAVMFTTLMKIL